jgi:AcrR family transcriptional regulator
VEVALEFLDRHDFEAFTMRRLARELGVTPMALYVYFRDKDELLDAVMDAGAREISLPSEEGPWREQLRELLHGVKRALERHPSALRFRVTRPFLGPETLRVPERGLRILQRAGFSRADAVSAWRALYSYTLGFACFSPDASGPDVRQRTRVAYAALPEDEFPALLAASAEILDAVAGDATFDFGLEHLLDGLESSCLGAKAKE